MRSLNRSDRLSCASVNALSMDDRVMRSTRKRSSHESSCEFTARSRFLTLSSKSGKAFESIGLPVLFLLMLFCLQTVVLSRWLLLSVIHLFREAVAARRHRRRPEGRN